MHFSSSRAPGAVALLLGLTLSLSPAASASDVAVGSEAPPFALPTLDGGTVDLADLRGKIVVLHFGTGW